MKTAVLKLLLFFSVIIGVSIVAVPVEDGDYDNDIIHRKLPAEGDEPPLAPQPPPLALDVRVVKRSLKSMKKREKDKKGTSVFILPFSLFSKRR